MGKSVTFIHAADVHLGAPFKGLRSLSEVWADRLVKAIPEAYQRIIEEALTEQVDFVIFAGDVFDNSRPSYADFTQFIDGLKQLEEAHIPVYLCTGNHDPYTSWKQDFADLPPNTHVFSPDHADFQVFSKDGEPLVILGGRSYYTQAWSHAESVDEGISREEAFQKTGVQAPFMVGVIHTGLDIDPTRSPVDSSVLLRKHLDYWACGHIHKPMMFPPEKPNIVFSGCPQGRAFNEQGERGIFKVTLFEDAPLSLAFIPTAQVVWEKLQVDISSCSTISDIQERIANEQFARNSISHCQYMICRVELTGASVLHAALTPQVISEVRQVLNTKYRLFFIDAIENHTRPVVDRDKLKKEKLFPAVFLQALDLDKADTSETLAYLEQQFYERDLVLPSGSERHVSAVYDEAESLVLDLLSNGEVL